LAFFKDFLRFAFQKWAETFAINSPIPISRFVIAGRKRFHGILRALRILHLHECYVAASGIFHESGLEYAAEWQSQQSATK